MDRRISPQQSQGHQVWFCELFFEPVQNPGYSLWIDQVCPRSSSPRWRIWNSEWRRSRKQIGLHQTGSWTERLHQGWYLSDMRVGPQAFLFSNLFHNIRHQLWRVSTSTEFSWLSRPLGRRWSPCLARSCIVRWDVIIVSTCSDSNHFRSLQSPMCGGYIVLPKLYLRVRSILRSIFQYFVILIGF